MKKQTVSAGRRWGLATLLVVMAVVTAVRAEDFAFVQISDIHVTPHLARLGGPPGSQAGEKLAWICDAAVGPQTIGPWNITTPAPAFALATGDLTEYGVIDDTWSAFEQKLAALKLPLYVLPGNHDNTWVAMYAIMRERYGGANYSFDKFGCHFVCLCSASPQEPVPSLDATTRAWLRHDLEAISRDTPVFVALHHPPDSNEFANPVEYDTLVDLLHDYNVVLMLYGHGHSVNHRGLDGIDGVMGGSTFGKNAGYNVISVQGDELRVAYHYAAKPVKDGEATEPGWKTLLKKPLCHKAPQRLFSIAGPREEVAESFKLTLRPEPSLSAANLAEIVVQIDGLTREAEALRDQAEPTWRVQAGELVQGRHLLTVRVKTTDGRSDLRTLTITTRGSERVRRWVRDLPMAIKAGPVVAGAQLIVAGTDGVVSALDRKSGNDVWSYSTGGEILGTPAWTGELLVFGSGDGHVYALDGAGKLQWTHDAGVPVYGWPTIADGTVYIGDNGGRLHALDLRDGKTRWTFERADFSIECQPCVWGTLVVFGAWDGWLYALNRADGTLAWKAWGPRSSTGGAARYYAPADCGPVAIGDTLFVCDRGYILAQYDLSGKPGERVSEGVAAIALDASGHNILARMTDDRVCEFDGRGGKLWGQAVGAGRFPIPPTCREGAVYVCSNRGLLSVLDPATGAIRMKYQTTPGYFVMAPVAADADGVCYVAGMDGSVTAINAAGR